MASEEAPLALPARKLTLVSQGELGWVAAMLDAKGLSLVKNNKSRATQQRVMAINSKDIDIINELGRLTGTAPDLGKHRHLKEWMQRACSEHCPEAHVHYDVEAKLPPIAMWTITGAGALIVLHNVRPYLKKPEKWAELERVCRENLRLTGQGSGMVRNSVRRLADLGWEIPPYFLDTGAFEGEDALPLPAGSLLRLFVGHMSCPCGREDYAACLRCPYPSCPVHGASSSQ